MTPAQILPLHLRLSINKSIGFYLALFALMLGLSSTFFTSHLLMRNVQHQIFMELEGRCDIFATRINERLDVYATILRGAAALFGASESVSRNDWLEYIGILDANKNIPGVTGIGFSQIISPRQLSAHTARIRQEGFPDYSVHPDGQRSIYTSIIYLEPFAGRNLRAFGFDMFSEPIRRNAMERARDTGDAALSRKVVLIQENGKDAQNGTLMYFPVYRKGAPLNNVSERQAAIIGWTYSPYRMKTLMLSILGIEKIGAKAQIVRLKIYDGLEANPTALLFDSAPDHVKNLSSQFHVQRRVKLNNGSHWLLDCAMDEVASKIDYTIVWITSILGVIISGLIFWLILSITNAIIRSAQLSLHDSLTKLANRSLLDDRLRQALAANRRNGFHGALLFIDLDNFKPINDTYGHRAGDLLLIEVSNRLKTSVRRVDTVARIGGDEFVILITELNRNEVIAKNYALRIAEKIRLSLAQPYILHLQEDQDSTVQHNCTASIGVELFDGEIEAEENILGRADHAMYRAKEAGRNRIKFSEEVK